MVNDIALDSSSSLSEDSATGQIAATGQKIDHRLEIGPGREEADFRRIGLAPRQANFQNLPENLAVQFSGPNFLAVQFSPGQFFSSPIFRPVLQSIFFLFDSLIVSKIGTVKNWTGAWAEKLDRTK